MFRNHIFNETKRVFTFMWLEETTCRKFSSLLETFLE